MFSFVSREGEVFLNFSRRKGWCRGLENTLVDKVRSIGVVPEHNQSKLPQGGCLTKEGMCRSFPLLRNFCRCNFKSNGEVGEAIWI